jgi:nicotinamidase/pyrazinamidase
LPFNIIIKHETFRLSLRRRPKACYNFIKIIPEREMTRIMRKSSYALVVVDLQLDFCPGGNLGVPEGNSIIPVINRITDLFETLGLPVFFSRDQHPEGHMSFAPQGGTWPPHCVKGTEGAELHPDLHIPAKANMINKAMEADKDAYSAFDGTDLAEILKKNRSTTIVVCGLATDYCVKATAMDGIAEGFEVIVITDAIKGVNVAEGDSEKALEEMKRAGITLYSSRKFIDSIEMNNIV